VGEHEADVKKGRISITSPIARAMIGKASGDVVEVRSPGGLKAYEITKVEWVCFTKEDPPDVDESRAVEPLTSLMRQQRPSGSLQKHDIGRGSTGKSDPSETLMRSGYGHRRSSEAVSADEAVRCHSAPAEEAWEPIEGLRRNFSDAQLPGR
jgi:hypothetical protein